MAEHHEAWPKTINVAAGPPVTWQAQCVGQLANGQPCGWKSVPTTDYRVAAAAARLHVTWEY